jgi:hypothetical protein
VYIKLPEPIVLTAVEIFARSDSRAPGRFKIYGSNDGKTWAVLHDQTSQVLVYTGNYSKLTINPPSIIKYYQYFGMVVGSLGASGADSYVLQIPELKLYGKSAGATCSKVDAFSAADVFNSHIFST